MEKDVRPTEPSLIERPEEDAAAHGGPHGAHDAQSIAGLNDQDVIAESAAPIRLTPDHPKAHGSLRLALDAAGDREAVREKPDYAGTHYVVGTGPKQRVRSKRRRRNICHSDPGNKKFQALYERLSKELKSNSACLRNRPWRWP